MSIYARRQMMGSSKKYTFGGVEISPGPLYYNGSSFEIKDSWNYSSYQSTYGKNSGSTYFSFIDIGQYFDADGSNFSTSSGSIDNANTLSGWRVPTQTEWNTIFTNRTGATVNGTSGCLYACIQLTSVTHAGSSTPYGLLVFPDGASMSGKTLSYVNSQYATTGVTSSELENYISQGCAFLPASGWVSYSWGSYNWAYGGTSVVDWSATQYSTSNSYHILKNQTSALNTAQSNSKTNLYLQVRLVKP